MTKYLIGILLLIAIVGGGYYFFAFSIVRPEEKKVQETIKIGFVGPLSGDSTSYGISVKNYKIGRAHV